MENVISETIETLQNNEGVETIVNNDENDTIKNSVKKGVPIIIGVTSFIGGLIVRPFIDNSINSFKKWREEKQLEKEEKENEKVNPKK